MVNILPQKSTLDTATYFAETVLPKVIKSTRQQRQTVGTSKIIVLHDNASARKGKVTVTFLQKQNIQVLITPPPPPRFQLGSV